MKILKSISVLTLLGLTLLSTGCHISFQRGSSGFQTPPCERNQTGTVCFSNETRRDVKVSIGETRTEIEAYSTICLDIYEGDYEYKAKQGFKKWEEMVYVERCAQEDIHISRR